MTASPAPARLRCPWCRHAVTARIPRTLPHRRAEHLPVEAPVPVFRVHGPRSGRCPGSGQPITTSQARRGPALAAPVLHAERCLGADGRLHCRCVLAVGRTR